MTDRGMHRDALPAGTRVEQFELVDVIGRGGFGITYLAWDSNLDINVAIKEYMPVDFAVREADHSVSPKTHGHVKDYEWGLGEFLKEARMLARFNHPSIVHVRQFFETRGTAYIVMERLLGKTLYARLEEEGTLGEEELRALLDSILSGLEQVHAAGYRHMDIKPGNIMLRNDGTPVLIDFGAAEIATAEQSRMVQSVVMPGYSPTEQYSSYRRYHGPWTDIYALGAVLYRAMTGIVPVDAPSRVQADELAPVGEVAKRPYSRSLSDAVAWALQVRAPERPQSIDAWREVLDEGWPEEPEPQPGPSLREEKQRARKPRRPAPWLIAFVAVLLVAAGLYYLYGETMGPGGGEEEKRANGSEGTQAAPQALAVLAEARALRRRGELGEARAKLAEARELGLPERDLRAEREKVDEAERLVGECDSHLTADRRAPALACFRSVLALAPEHAEARKQALRLEMYLEWDELDQPDTPAERYAAFEKKYADRLAEFERVKLEGEAKILINLARVKQLSQ